MTWLCDQSHKVILGCECVDGLVNVLRREVEEAADAIDAAHANGALLALTILHNHRLRDQSEFMALFHGYISGKYDMEGLANG